jgi:3-dehydroquinate synthase
VESARIPVGRVESPDYLVEVTPGLLSRLGDALASHGIRSRVIVCSTPTVWRIVAPTLPPPLRISDPILLPDGERYKGLPTVSRAYDALVRAGADRGTTVVAIGGGVLGDTAGFAAATFLRGLPLVHVPTTLLAQVDSAIGGKVGVNHPLGKNLIGAFHPPRAVLVDPDALASLPRREFRAGLYEVVKYAVIASRSLLDTLAARLGDIFARKRDALVPVIAECCGIKARVVTADERETGLRRILNFGHTVGHAIEAATRYRRFRHGEAVALGMIATAHLATRRGRLAATDRDTLAALIAAMGPLPPVADLHADDLLDAIRRDKKIVDGCLHFVLPSAIGTVEIVTDVTERELAAALADLGVRTSR